MASKSRHGGKRPGAGRPKSGRNPASMIGEKFYLSPADREYLRRWNPDGNGSAQLAELIGRARAFWPRGPSTNPTMSPELLAKHGGDA